MADMKQIFTYPNNGGTNYIDPTYVGNATSGLTKRVDELLAGAYKDWSNLDPVSDLGTTSSEAMQNLSKFITYEGANQTGVNITFYDFWNNPVVIANKVPVAPDATILLGDTLNPGTITTTADNEFTSGMKIRLSGMNGSWQSMTSPTTDYYAKIIDADELQVSRNSALTDLVGYVGSFTDDLTTTLLQRNDTITVTLTNTSDYPDGTSLVINSVQYNGQAMVGNTYYLKEVAVPVYELYQDVGLTNPLTPSDILPFSNYSLTGTFEQQQTIAKVSFANTLLTKEEVIYPSPVFYGDEHPLFPTVGLGLASFLKPTANPLEYEVYTDEARTIPVEGGANREIDLLSVEGSWNQSTLDNQSLKSGGWNHSSVPGGDFFPYYTGVAFPIGGGAWPLPSGNLSDGMGIGTNLYGLYMGHNYTRFREDWLHWIYLL